MDFLAELLVRLPMGLKEEDLWEESLRLGRRLLELHKAHGGNTDIRFLTLEPPPCPSATRRVAAFPADARRIGLIWKGQVSLVEFEGGSALVSSGSLRADEVRRSIIFATGDAEVRDAQHAIVVSDGNLTVHGLAENCLFVARGKVICIAELKDCRVVSGNTVTFHQRMKKPLNCQIMENETTPLGFVKFFDPSREGITVEPAEGGVRIKHADSAKPFAKAGLRAGDLILTTGGEATTSPEEFRRVLRAQLVADADLTFRVRRDSRELTIRVPRPE